MTDAEEHDHLKAYNRSSEGGVGNRWIVEKQKPENNRCGKKQIIPENKFTIDKYQKKTKFIFDQYTFLYSEKVD